MTTPNVHIETGLVALKESHFHMERAFFALNATTAMTDEQRNQGKELMVEMVGMMNQLKLTLFKKDQSVEVIDE